MNKFIEQAKHGVRCYCSHELKEHQTSFAGCDLCDCEKFDALPFDFFQRCPSDICNSIYFYPDDVKSDIFHCHSCEHSFKFDGYESFTDLLYENLGTLDNMGDL